MHTDQLSEYVKRREDNINMDLKIGYEGVNYIHIAQGKGQWRALVNTGK
jgi:hypothetical protein